MGKKYAVRGELSEERRAKIRESLLQAAGDEKTTLVLEQDVLHLVGAKPHEFGAVLQQLDQMEAEGALAASRLISRIDCPSGTRGASPEYLKIHRTSSGAAMRRRKATFQMLRIRRTALIS